MARSEHGRRPVSEAVPDPIDVHIGSRLRTGRVLAGMSLNELAAAIGVSFQAVQKYECGENRLSVSRLYKVARALNQPIRFFFDEIEDNPAVPERTDFTQLELELVRHFRRISNETIRDHLQQMVMQIS